MSLRPLDDWPAYKCCGRKSLHSRWCLNKEFDQDCPDPFLSPVAEPVDAIS